MMYRVGGMLWVINGAIPILISMYIWKLVSPETSQISIYFIGAILFERITQTWSLGEISDRIKDGTLAQTLLRPYNYIFEIFARDVGSKANRLVSTLPFVVVLWFVYLPQYNFNPINILVGIPALILGYLVNFYLNSSLGLLTNWTGDADGIARTLDVTKSMTAGLFIPYMFMPQAVKDILVFTPFRYIFSFPLEIVLGQLSSNSLLFGYATIIFWSLFLVFIFNWLSKKSMKYFTSHGG